MRMIYPFLIEKKMKKLVVMAFGHLVKTVKSPRVVPRGHQFDSHRQCPQQKKKASSNVSLPTSEEADT